MSDDELAEPIDDPKRRRITIAEEGQEAQLTYKADDGRLYVFHTVVPESLGGRGIGTRLALAAIDKANAEGLTLVPWCPFVREMLEEHPERADSVRVDFRSQPPVG